MSSGVYITLAVEDHPEILDEVFGHLADLKNFATMNNSASSLVSVGDLSGIYKVETHSQ